MVLKNDRVLVSSYTFISSATSVLNLGAVPIPMNFSFDTGIDLRDLENELKKVLKLLLLFIYKAEHLICRGDKTS